MTTGYSLNEMNREIERAPVVDDQDPLSLLCQQEAISMSRKPLFDQEDEEGHDWNRGDDTRSGRVVKRVQAELWELVFV